MRGWLAGAMVCLWLGVMLSACRSVVTTPAASLSVIPPTWTPTPVHASETHPAPTMTPVAPTPPASPTSLVPMSAPSPPARIDAAGPEAVPTIVPLPPGEGRSPVRLLIPALGMDVPVQPMGWRTVEDAQGVRTEWDVPDFAAGHHIDSAFPGERGNVVISGHNNIGDAVFAPLSTIGEPGNPLTLKDAIIVEDALGRRFIYRITGWRRFPEANASVALRRENASYLLPTDFPQLTLITCWPPASNTHRVIITGALTGIRTP